MNRLTKLFLATCLSLFTLTVVAQEWVEYEELGFNCDLLYEILEEFGDQDFFRDGDEISDLFSYFAEIEASCVESMEAAMTPTPRTADFVGLYGDSGDFEFCVTTDTLNVRNAPGGSVVDRLDRGSIFTVDLGSKVKADGYVWAEHDKGWSALYPLNYTDTDELSALTHPMECPQPTPTPTMRPVAGATVMSQADLKNLMNSTLDSLVDSVSVTPSSSNVLVKVTLLHGDSDILVEAAIEDIGKSICILKNNGYRSYILTFMGSHPSDSEPFSIKFRSKNGTTANFRCPVQQLSVTAMADRLAPITEFSDFSDWLIQMTALGM